MSGDLSNQTESSILLLQFYFYAGQGLHTRTSFYS